MKPVAIRANYEDCEEILALQKLAFQSEAAIYDDPTIPPLTQTLNELRNDYYAKNLLKIVLDGKIVASIRGYNKGGFARIERVMVHPDYQKRGLGYILMEGIEEHLLYHHDELSGEKSYTYEAHTYKLYTGNRSIININWYKKLGYSIEGQDEIVSPKLSITRMIKSTPKPLRDERNLPLKIKVCGMRDADNIRALTELPIDYMGFIFYEKSARYVSKIPDLSAIDGVISNHPVNTKRIKKVGVFVNAEIDFVLKKVEDFGLAVAQLHGKETPQYIEDLKIQHSKLAIWKVFSVDETFDFNETKPYEGLVDKFLFDTKTPLHGGSGQKFDWNILTNYHGQTPFFLSGGISAADTEGVKNIQHPMFYGLDVNSKFEIAPALKDVGMLREFLFSLDLL